MNKEKVALFENILHEVYSHYTNSSDFNGISLTNLMKLFKLNEVEMKNIIKEMLQNNKITLTFSSVFLNPYIKAFHDLSVEKQITLLDNESTDGICVYPSPHYLKQISSPKYTENEPYSRRLFYGEPHFQPVYFELSVLEKFFNDPRYIVHNDDYSGSIYVRSEFYDEMQEKDKINLQTFGLAYTEQSERCIIVYLRYLAKLSPDQQQYWKRYEISGKCKQNIDYLRNTLGEWAENVSIFIAFLEELHHVCEMTKKIGKPPLFRNDYKNNRPKEFAVFLRPTLKNYESFVHSLDKMLSENINKEFFRGDISLEEEIERADGKIEVRTKGTIALLEEWITSRFKPKDPEPMKKLFATLKRIRRERQKPAHSIQEDVYDKKYFKLQDDLIIDAYSAVRTLRLIFANHPLLKSYKVPDWLYEGKITLY
ncbi:hypothetical protein [Carboxydocella sp. JDF658]|uniref:hypothetical protein n=1 Tax=Carboxydocella sp. JDF658 TaxID=1926600 RepID=UPI0009AC8CFE|nr:hypothetical protein [Carboxydocella sp. JDF658]GAW32074.1 hypothetical protein JDF658_18390 [Carboxydocella sp. JDF658]